MSSSSVWQLIDASAGLHRAPWTVGPTAVSDTPPGWSVTLRRLTGGRSDGVDVVEIDNGAAQFVILPTRGMGIWKAKCGPISVGWQSPIRGPVHPHFVPLTEPSGLGWLDGFDELLVRCGLESNGAPEFDNGGRLRYGLHGRIANTPAHHLELAVDPAAGEISISAELEEARFHFQKLRLRTVWVTRFGEHGFRVHDEVTNFGGTATGFQLLYHLNLGQPLLGPGAQLVAPVAELAPRDDGAAGRLADCGQDDWASYPEPQAGISEQCYFARLLGDTSGRTEVLLADASAERGVSLHYNVRQLPCFTQWKNPAADEDGYVTGLEPATNFPNTRSFEERHGRVVNLEPGGSQQAGLELRVHTDAAEVAAAQQRVREIQQQAPAKLHAQPLAEWSE